MQCLSYAFSLDFFLICIAQMLSLYDSVHTVPYRMAWLVMNTLSGIWQQKTYCNCNCKRNTDTPIPRGFKNVLEIKNIDFAAFNSSIKNNALNPRLENKLKK